MSIQSFLFRRGAAKSDRKRDSQIPLPQGVHQTCDISYGPYGKWNLLDIYHPEGCDCCPVILNIHGGGFVYGTKEIYKRYCMDLARRGFTVVNINYRLAPRWKFPTPLEDINQALLWLQENSRYYHADITRLFMVGDSAGAVPIPAFSCGQWVSTADCMTWPMWPPPSARGWSWTIWEERSPMTIPGCR